MLRCLLQGSDEVEITVHSDGSTLKISFDPLTVIGETRKVEELITRDEGSQHFVLFWREGKLYRETKDNSAYMG